MLASAGERIGERMRIISGTPVKAGSSMGYHQAAGSTSKQLPFDQLEGCLIGFAKDGQIVYPRG